MAAILEMTVYVVGNGKRTHFINLALAVKVDNQDALIKALLAHIGEEQQILVSLKLRPAPRTRSRQHSLLRASSQQPHKKYEHSWELVRSSRAFQSRVETLEQSLKALPDPPIWSLKNELLAVSNDSRTDEPVLARSLTTAIQIALFDAHVPLALSLMQSWAILQGKWPPRMRPVCFP